MVAPLGAAALFVLALCVRLFGRRDLTRERARLVWGSAPIINNALWSRAMREAGWPSVSYTDGFAEKINRREDYDLVIQERWGALPLRVARLVAFGESLLRYDVFFLSFEGFFLGKTALWALESKLLALAGKKVVVIPFGSDAYVYRRVASLATAHGLMMSVPWARRAQRRVSLRVEHWVDRADAVIPGTMGPDGIGRWDLLAPTSLCLDLSLWTRSTRVNGNNGTDGPVVIAHAPNFRGFKGSEFLIRAVEELQREGLKIELRLIERVQNAEVRRILQEDTDILVEQLIATGHGLNAVEGMACGLPVVSNLEDERLLLPFRRWSFLNECPIASASPETVVSVLRKLVTRPELRAALGSASRSYAEKYCSFDAAAFQFGAVVDALAGKDVDLIGLCDPVKGPYTTRAPKVVHPLVKNQIVD